MLSPDSPTLRRRWVLAATGLAASLLLLPVHATAADDDHATRPGPAGLLPATAVRDGEAPAQNTFLGSDGAVHTRAGWTVKGRHGTVFLGEEFDSACATGSHFDEALDRLARFARIIRKSGREVVFTVTPSKSAVDRRDLPRHPPHGSCDTTGIKAQNDILDGYTDPSYLPLRQPLATAMRAGVPAYWTLDSHWTTLGSTRWAQLLATRLDPRIAARQRYVPGRRTHVPDIAYVLGRHDVKETEDALLTKTDVRTTYDPGSPGYHPVRLTGFDISWTTNPRPKTWSGRTLLLGDSFTYVGMESLIPLFHHGRFMWAGHVDNDDLIQAVTESDTVVIEVAQRYVATGLYGDPTVQAALALALATSGPAS